MASVFERNGRWRLQVKDAQGRWIQLPCKAKTKTEARRIVDELDRALSPALLTEDRPTAGAI